jgi:two-component system nitrogen regulation sensor histidine kinase NtrY
MPPDPAGPGRERTLERRLLGWLLALTVAPALLILAVGGWALGISLDLAGALGPWEEVAESGRRVVELGEPIGDSALVEALADHRQALSLSLTQARRWAFLGERFVDVLPWLVLAVAIALVALAYAATRKLARQLARPIEDLVVLADRLGRAEPLPEPPRRSLHEVRALDTALRDAATELAVARERAVAAERVRVWGEMARRVAHEMKNPLTPLRFAAHRLRAGGSSSSGASGASPAPGEVVDVIDEEVARLEELAAQFGQLGRPPEGPPSEVDLRELLASLLETDVADRARSTLVAPERVPPVLGHYDTLFRAFRNLVRNALEAVEEAEDPWIGVTLEIDEDGAGGRWLVARVRDNGGGLPGSGTDRIFEPDFTTKSHGTGLGLALVRQAVTSDGGTVEARDRNDGAEFVVRLPVTETEEPGEEDPA